MQKIFSKTNTRGEHWGIQGETKIAISNTYPNYPKYFFPYLTLFLLPDQTIWVIQITQIT
jgi:hypothetical protein